MIWKCECCCPKAKPKKKRVKENVPPGYLNGSKIRIFLKKLTGYKWKYNFNTSPFDKPGWKAHGIKKAYYRWLADTLDDNPNIGFTVPKNPDHLMFIPHAHGSDHSYILNSGDTTPKRHASWSMWLREDAVMVDPRELPFTYSSPTHCCCPLCC